MWLGAVMRDGVAVRTRHVPITGDLFARGDLYLSWRSKKGTDPRKVPRAAGKTPNARGTQSKVRC